MTLHFEIFIWRGCCMCKCVHVCVRVCVCVSVRVSRPPQVSVLAFHLDEMASLLVTAAYPRLAGQ